MNGLCWPSMRNNFFLMWITIACRPQITPVFQQVIHSVKTLRFNFM